MVESQSSREPQKVSQRSRTTNGYAREKWPRDSRIEDQANDAGSEPEQQKRW